MQDKTKIHLTAPEMSGLWTQYINDTLVTCVSSYFLNTVKDEQLRPIIEWTHDTAKENLSIMEEIFQKENFPIPIGFTEKDVNPEAPKLFGDTFIAAFLNQLSKFAMVAGGTTLGVTTRPDIVAFQKRILEKGTELLDKTRDLMLKQGTYIKPPTISTSDEVDFVKKQHFLAGFFGKKRSITATEITNLHLNIIANAIGKALITGFAQTAENKDVKQYFLRGIELSQKYVDTFSEFLREEDLLAPIGLDSHISHSTTPVFSDKLMMYNVAGMISGGIGNFGAAIAASARRDLGLKYASLLPEITLYAEDGANIMIKHGWMEEPPQADDRDELIGN